MNNNNEEKITITSEETNVSLNGNTKIDINISGLTSSSIYYICMEN